MLIVSTENASGEQLDKVFKAGYRAIDCSPSYGNQESVGKCIAQSSISREALFVISKARPCRDNCAVGCCTAGPDQ